MISIVKAGRKEKVAAECHDTFRRTFISSIIFSAGKIIDMERSHS